MLHTCRIQSILRGLWPDRLIHRFDGVGAVGVINQEGDFSIEVDGRRYWDHGVWAYHLYRLEQLKRLRQQPGGRRYLALADSPNSVTKVPGRRSKELASMQRHRRQQRPQTRVR